MLSPKKISALWRSCRLKNNSSGEDKKLRIVWDIFFWSAVSAKQSAINSRPLLQLKQLNKLNSFFLFIALFFYHRKLQKANWRPNNLCIAMNMRLSFTASTIGSSIYLSNYILSKKLCPDMNDIIFINFLDIF